MRVGRPGTKNEGRFGRQETGHDAATPIIQDPPEFGVFHDDCFCILILQRPQGDSQECLNESSLRGRCLGLVDLDHGDKIRGGSRGILLKEKGEQFHSVFGQGFQVEHEHAFFEQGEGMNQSLLLLGRLLLIIIAVAEFVSLSQGGMKVFGGQLRNDFVAVSSSQQQQLQCRRMRRLTDFGTRIVPEMHENGIQLLDMSKVGLGRQSLEKGGNGRTESSEHEIDASQFIDCFERSIRIILCRQCSKDADRHG